jgi:hypothetical protein
VVVAETVRRFLRRFLGIDEVYGSWRTYLAVLAALSVWWWVEPAPWWTVVATGFVVAMVCEAWRRRWRS